MDHERRSETPGWLSTSPFRLDSNSGNGYSVSSFNNGHLRALKGDCIQPGLEICTQHETIAVNQGHGVVSICPTGIEQAPATRRHPANERIPDIGEYRPPMTLFVSGDVPDME